MELKKNSIGFSCSVVVIPASPLKAPSLWLRGVQTSASSTFCWDEQQLIPDRLDQLSASGFLTCCRGDAGVSGVVPQQRSVSSLLPVRIRVEMCHCGGRKHPEQCHGAFTILLHDLKHTFNNPVCRARISNTNA